MATPRNLVPITPSTIPLRKEEKKYYQRPTSTTLPKNNTLQKNNFNPPPHLEKYHQPPQQDKAEQPLHHQNKTNRTRRLRVPSPSRTSFSPTLSFSTWTPPPRKKHQIRRKTQPININPKEPANWDTPLKQQWLCVLWTRKTSRLPALRNTHAAAKDRKSQQIKNCQSSQF